MRIQNLAVGLMALTAIAGVRPAASEQQEDNKALEVLASARQAIGGRKIESLQSLSVQAAMQRNVGNVQMNSDVELLLEMPDKYLRSETSTGGMAGMTTTLGFNADRPLNGGAPAGLAPGGGMIIRMGGPGGTAGGGEKPTPEQQQQLDRQMVRSARQEISRLMLGWFGRAHPSLSAQYTYGGEAESPDGKASVIDVKNADGFAARLFVDAKTRLPLMVTYQGPQPRMVLSGGPRTTAGGTQPAPQGQGRQMGDEERARLSTEVERQARELQRQPATMVDYTVFFDDWREVDGIRFPHALRRASAGATTEEWTISKVKVNPKIDVKKFETKG